MILYYKILLHSNAISAMFGVMCFSFISPSPYFMFFSFGNIVFCVYCQIMINEENERRKNIQNK